MIRFALSRSREYLADAGSVELTKNPDAMALRKIEGRGHLARANSAIMEMCVDNPPRGFCRSARHPSLDPSRIDAVGKFAGGHDPGPIELTSPDEVTAQAEPGTVGPWGRSQTSPDATGSRDAGALLPGGPQPWAKVPPLSPWGHRAPQAPLGPRQSGEP